MGVIILLLLFYSRITPHTTTCSIAALAFTFHPMLTQCVNGVAGQGPLLSLLCSLAVAYLFLWHRESKLSLLTTLVLILPLSFLAFGAHEMGLILPFWLLILGLLRPTQSPHPLPNPMPKSGGRGANTQNIRNTPRPRRDTVILILAMTVVLAIYLTFRAKALDRLLPMPTLANELLAPVSAPAWLIAPSVILLYLCRIFWPIHPTLIYDLTYETERLPPLWLGWLALGILIVIIVLAYRWWRPMALALLLLLVPLIALSHWLPLSAFMTEGPLGFALVGASLGMGLVARRLIEWPGWLPNPLWRHRIVASLATLAIITMGWQGFARNRQWNEAETLWRAEALLHPADAQPLINLLHDHLTAARLNRAQELLDQAKQLKSTWHHKDQDKLTQLEALLYIDQGEIRKLRQLLRDELNNPIPHDRGHMSKLALVATGIADAKLESLLRAELQAYPDSYEATFRLANLLREKQQKLPAEKRDFDETIELAQRAIPLSPKSLLAQSHALYGLILTDVGSYKEAVFTLQTALNLDRTLYRPYIRLTQIYWGRKDYALAEDAIARGLNHANVTSFVDLAQLYTGIMEDRDRVNKALDWLVIACRDYPGDVPLRMFAARYLIVHRRFEQA